MTVTELVSRLATDSSARGLAEREFSRWWAEHDPTAHTLLNELARRGPEDPTALEVLLGIVDRHGLARPALRTMLVAEHDVEDAEQSTLAAVALRVDQFDGRARFTTWLHQVAINEARMLIRSRARRPPVQPGEIIREPMFVARLSTILADRDVVQRALASLPEIHRTLIELREFAGLDYDEIARTIELPIGTVRSRLSRARVALATALRAELAGT